MALGFSERGLSSVTMMWSASSSAMPPISGRLPGSRSPPQPNTHHSVPFAMFARARAALWPAHRACARSRPRPAGLSRRRLPPAPCGPARRGNRASARAASSSGTSSASRQASTTSEFSALKRPMQTRSPRCSAPKLPSSSQRDAVPRAALHLRGAQRRGRRASPHCSAPIHTAVSGTRLGVALRELAAEVIADVDDDVLADPAA